jgi:hypothetical protein
LFPEQVIIESFAGIGISREHAVAECVQNLAHSVVAVIGHVSMGKNIEGAHCQILRICGEERLVVLSDPLMRGRSDKENQTLGLEQWLANAEEAIAHHPFTTGVHWVRLFYMQRNGELFANEVMSDNEIDSSLQKCIERIALPATPEVYSIRQFGIIVAGGNAQS